MSVFSRRSEPQPILIGLPELKSHSRRSRVEEASQTTVIDERLYAPGRCGCGHVIGLGDCFCGGCGVRLSEALVK